MKATRPGSVPRPTRRGGLKNRGLVPLGAKPTMDESKKLQADDKLGKLDAAEAHVIYASTFALWAKHVADIKSSASRDAPKAPDAPEDTSAAAVQVSTQHVVSRPAAACPNVALRPIRKRTQLMTPVTFAPDGLWSTERAERRKRFDAAALERRDELARAKAAAEQEARVAVARDEQARRRQLASEGGLQFKAGVDISFVRANYANVPGALGEGRGAQRRRRLRRAAAAVARPSVDLRTIHDCMPGQHSGAGIWCAFDHGDGSGEVRPDGLLAYFDAGLLPTTTANTQPQRPSDSCRARGARPTSRAAGSATNGDCEDDGYVYEDDFDDDGDAEEGVSERIAEERPEDLAAEAAAD